MNGNDIGDGMDEVQKTSVSKIDKSKNIAGIMATVIGIGLVYVGRAIQVGLVLFSAGVMWLALSGDLGPTVIQQIGGMLYALFMMISVLVVEVFIRFVTNLVGKIKD